MIHIFIINRVAGNKDWAKDLRKHLATKKGLRYFVFTTVSAGFEKTIVQKIGKYFEDEKLRFYCCGGSGTMRNMLDGFEDLSKIEVAFFPCGLTNDFLKCIGDEEIFRDIDKLIDGKVVPIDYIKTNHGVALNTLSFGCDSNVEQCMNAFRSYDIFGSQIPYVLSVLKGIIFAKTRRIELTLDGEVFAGKYAEIVYGNGAVLGGNLFFAQRADVTDGVGSYFTVTDIRGLQALIQILHLMQKKLSVLRNNVKYGECKRLEIKSLDGNPLFINYDGELVDCGQSCKAEIVRKGLNFVVPKSVELKEYRLY